jgi:signal transduction histidine kinase
VEDGEREKLRFILHELSNLLTGMLVSGGLLRQAMKNDPRSHYADEVCEAGDRGAALVREARNLLTAPEERLQEAEQQRV